MFLIAFKLIWAGIKHDWSKFTLTEMKGFIKVAENFSDIEYGSKEYKKLGCSIFPVLKRHWAKNSHHPEYYQGDISRMSIIDLIEMACDWVAATKYHKNGKFERSLKINTDRFNLSTEDIKFINLIKKELD